jgi:acyl carrier protein
MNEEAVWSRLSEIFRDVFDDEDILIDPKTVAEDILEWDSLSNIQLLVAIEKAFDGVKFNTGEVANLKNVGEMVDIIIQRSSS